MHYNLRIYIIFVFGILYVPLVLAQQTLPVTGKVVDENNEPLPGVSVIDISLRRGVTTLSDGTFRLEVQPDRTAVIEFYFIGYKRDTLVLMPATNRSTSLEIRLEPEVRQIDDVIVEGRADIIGTMQRIDIKSAEQIPLLSGNVESILPTLGASSRNEMSSQYSVRGGNFDENLVIVNDIEVYRPLLVKSGQQEGLSFINSEMISTIQFAAGGFDARYGDKMSSVLDIRYKRPSAFAGSISGSLLGGSVHLEGKALKDNLTYITGLRYKSNRYVLNSLQTSGEYKPRFLDFQTYITYKLHPKLEIGFLGNFSGNHYEVIPQSRQTSFGTYQQALNFTVYYEGKEEDSFSTLLGALTFDYKPSDRVFLKFTGTGYQTSEAITYDILGQYWIDVLDNTIGSETAGDSILNIGVGGNLNHARNYLDARIFNISHKGSWLGIRKSLYWGLSMQSEDFSDKIREWEMIDSAGYSLPYSDNNIMLFSSTASKNILHSIRYAAYLQHNATYRAGSGALFLNAGFRLNYIGLSGQFLFSPRMGLRYMPSWNEKVEFHLAFGWYHQPAFYKEMRDPAGMLHTNLRAQESIHYILGATWDFNMWQRPFRLSSEVYYKRLRHLIPYVIDDVEIQYLPQYTAKGYATGIEFKINGEFVENAESWASLSFLRTREDRYHDDAGDYPRPTDQLINFGLYFQDYFPSNPSYRVHLNLYYGSRLPYNSTDYDQPENYYHLSSYRRIDLGLSKSLITNKNGQRKANLQQVHDVRLGLEVFNLFGFKNQASYQWVRTINNQEGLPNMFAVPNYLTGRLVNVRFTIEF